MTLTGTSTSYMYFEAKETARELSYPRKRGLGDRVHSYTSSVQRNLSDLDLSLAVAGRPTVRGSTANGLDSSGRTKRMSWF